MAKITKNVVRNFETQADTNTVAVAAGVHIFQGMLLGLNDGYARPFQAGDKIVGFAKDEIDNRNGQAGDKKVDVKAKGKICLEIASLAQTSIGSDVVATDDDTFALGSDGDYFGKVLRLEDSAHAIVAFDFIYVKETAAETTTEETPASNTPETPAGTDTQGGDTPSGTDTPAGSDTPGGGDDTSGTETTPEDNTEQNGGQ